MLKTAARVLGFSSLDGSKLEKFFITIPDYVPLGLQVEFREALMGYLNSQEFPGDISKLTKAMDGMLAHFKDMGAIHNLTQEVLTVIERNAAYKVQFAGLNPRAVLKPPVDEPQVLPTESTEFAEKGSLLESIYGSRPSAEEFFTLLESMVCNGSINCNNCFIPSLRKNVKDYCRELMLDCPTPEVMVEHGCCLPWYPPEYEALVEEVMHAESIEFDGRGLAVLVNSGHPGAVDGKIALARLIVENMLLIEDPESKFLMEVPNWDPILDPSVFIQVTNDDVTDLTPENWNVAGRCISCRKSCSNAA